MGIPKAVATLVILGEGLGSVALVLAIVVAIIVKGSGALSIDYYLFGK